MLHQAVQGATAPISTYEDMPPLSHEPAGGFSAECEEEVAKLPPPPLDHENQRFSLCRDLRHVSVIETYGLRFSETYGLLYVMFDFWRLSLHRLKYLIYYVAIYSEIN